VTHQFFSLSFSSRCLVSLFLGEVWLVFRYQRSALCFTSHPAFASPPSSVSRSEIHHLAPCSLCVMLACWLFFSFAMLFGFGCCSLPQKMSFVDCYLPYLRQWLITLPPLALLPLQPLFIVISHKDQLLASPPFYSALRALWPLCCVSLFSSLFIIQDFFVFVARGQSVQGAMLVYTRYGCGYTTCHLFAQLFVCWMSPKQVWSQHLAAGELSCFLSVTWYGEAL
jgi:hypothetical protein